MKGVMWEVVVVNVSGGCVDIRDERTKGEMDWKEGEECLEVIPPPDNEQKGDER